MRILQVHKYHHSLGGAETYYLQLSKLLRKKGHTVSHFSMQHEDNIPNKWSKYFVSNVDFRHFSFTDLIKVNLRMIFSFEAKRKMGKLLEEFRPDVAHIHNIYYSISPSILLELKKRKVPVIYTVHDYHLLTPNIIFYHDGAICNLGVKDSLFKIVLHKCVRNHYLGSFVTGLVTKLHRKLGLYTNNVDYFIAPSLFMEKKLEEYNFDKRKIIHLPNFVDTRNFLDKPVKKKGGYVLYFGRFYEQKGVLLLPEVAKRLPKVKFKIVGQGPVEKKLKDKAEKFGINNIEFLDFQEADEIKKTIAGSVFCVVPSLWYEPMPYSVLESFASCRPVIASRIGGIPEVVEDGENGFLVLPGDIDELTEKISLLWEDRALARKMGKSARQTVLESFNQERHYEKLISVYQKAANS